MNWFKKSLRELPIAWVGLAIFGFLAVGMIINVLTPKPNAKCFFCHTPAYVDPKYRTEPSGMYKKIYCPECGQSSSARMWFVRDSPNEKWELDDKTNP